MLKFLLFLSILLFTTQTAYADCASAMRLCEQTRIEAESATEPLRREALQSESDQYCAYAQATCAGRAGPGIGDFKPGFVQVPTPAPAPQSHCRPCETEQPDGSCKQWRACR